MLRASSHGFPSPTHVRKPRHGGKVPIFQSQETIEVWLIFIRAGCWLFDAGKFTGFVSRVGSSFMLDPTLNTSPEPHIQKVSSCGHSCHTWDPVWSGQSQLPCSQQLRLHGLTSSDLGLETWDHVWTGPKFYPYPYQEGGGGTDISSPIKHFIWVCRLEINTLKLNKDESTTNLVESSFYLTRHDRCWETKSHSLW